MFYKKNIFFVSFFSIKTKTQLLKRIRSVPGNNVLEVKSSAIIQPTDQISTTIKNIYFKVSHFYNSSKIINYTKI